MERAFDDIAAAISQPRTEAWGAVRVVALYLAGKLFLGIAIGLGIGIGLAIAG